MLATDFGSVTCLDAFNMMWLINVKLLAALFVGQALVCDLNPGEQSLALVSVYPSIHPTSPSLPSISPTIHLSIHSPNQSIQFTSPPTPPINLFIQPIYPPTHPPMQQSIHPSTHSPTQSIQLPIRQLQIYPPSYPCNHISIHPANKSIQPLSLYPPHPSINPPTHSFIHSPIRSAIPLPTPFIHPSIHQLILFFYIHV